MQRYHFLSAALFLVPTLLAGCGEAPSSTTDDPDAPDFTEVEKPSADLHVLLAALPRARVALASEAGVPSFLTGHLGLVEINGDPAAADLRGAIAKIAPIFRANAEDLELKRAATDTMGDVHYRLQQRKNGLEVLGAELAVHVRDGMIYATNGEVMDDAAAPSRPAFDAASAGAAALSASPSIRHAATMGEPRLAYHRSGDKLSLVYVVEVIGSYEDDSPAEEGVLVNALDRSITARISRIHSAKNREIHNLNNSTTLPGAIARAEGDPASADATVNNNYYRMGLTYECFSDLFGRDSYNDLGIKIVSSVHYGTSWVNAAWKPSAQQFVFGDGNGVQSSNLADALDVTAHEFNHAVTEKSSGLIYHGESGGLNESMSDIMGATCEWFIDGMMVSADTWKVGEEVWTPGTADDALRYMDNPALDGGSLDWYPDYAPGVDVHYSSGISNLAFQLLAEGGTHPRGKSATVVSGVGMDQASQIFYYANAYIMGPSTNFPGAKIATEIAAQQLGYGAGAVAAVTAAWQAVGVGLPAPAGNVALVNNSTQMALSGAVASERFFTIEVPPDATNLSLSIAGGPGDADIYVSHAVVPTLTSYDCRPYSGSSNETCTFSNPTPGTYYVMLRGYSAYSAVNLSASYQAGLQNGVTVDSLSGASGSQVFWTFVVPPGKTQLIITTNDGAGDADLYVRRGSQPTTGSYDCASTSTSTSEACVWTFPSSGTYHVMVRGYHSFAGVALRALYL